MVRRSTGRYGVWGHSSPENFCSFYCQLHVAYNLSWLMKIAVEGPELSSAPFEEILDVN